MSSITIVSFTTRWEGNCKGKRQFLNIPIHLSLVCSYPIFLPLLDCVQLLKGQLSAIIEPATCLLDNSYQKLYRLLVNTFNPALNKELQTVTIWYTEFLENIRRLVSALSTLFIIWKCIRIHKFERKERTFILQMREKYLLIPFMN